MSFYRTRSGTGLGTGCVGLGSLVLHTGTGVVEGEGEQPRCHGARDGVVTEPPIRYARVPETLGPDVWFGRGWLAPANGRQGKGWWL